MAHYRRGKPYINQVSNFDEQRKNLTETMDLQKRRRADGNKVEKVHDTARCNVAARSM